MGEAEGFTCARDYQLLSPGPKQILAIDGVGTRAPITIAFLERIEALLTQHHGGPVRLGDHFQLVGGTSAGAIIAVAIALGFSAADVKRLYLDLRPLAFRKRMRIPLLQPEIDSRQLRTQIEAIVGDRELQSENLITGLCVITKRIDTGAPWVISNNPAAPYWNDGPGHDGNRHYKLANIVRASTAAPHYFDPELIPINSQKMLLAPSTAKPMQRLFLVRFAQAVLERIGWRSNLDPTDYGIFIDGGMSPHNNPSLALLQMVTLRGYNLQWMSGPRNLTLISVGAGRFIPRATPSELERARRSQLTLLSAQSLIRDLEDFVLQEMQYLSECPTPWRIDNEAGIDANEDDKLCRFVRYDVELESRWIRANLDLDISEKDVARYRSMDDAETDQGLYDIGRLAAERQIRIEHLLPALN
jgi:hypothetical protein